MSGLVSGIVLAGLVLIRLPWRPTIQPRESAAIDAGELPPVALSPFRNARTDVAYTGAAKCQACHPQEHESYDRTAHSKALADLDAAIEPADGEFDDPKSQRTYRVHREGDTMRHEESIKTASGEKFVLADLPIRYVIGSGRFSRSYLVEREGFLYESPATWYAARPGWGLSPGYAQSNPGFKRPVELRCLLCHVGHIESVDHSPLRVDIHTQAIDCERCHGPGSLHVQKRETAGESSGSSEEHDDTIVNPSRLDRQRREDICAQCHFHSGATIELRGRDVLDFRPGERLADYLVHFGLKKAGQQMIVVGHVEQMRLSRCYQSSDSLTCTTCHSPHAKPAAEDSQTFYRNKCLACHTEQSCGLPQSERLSKDSTDYCVACHMPRSPTEIPHFAFNHHRIGIHSPDVPARPLAEPGELIPLDDVAWMSRADQARNLGLGYLQLSDGSAEIRHGSFYREQALAILEQIDQRHYNDVEVRAALARLYWMRKDTGSTLVEARAVMAAPHASADALATACFTLGATIYDLDQPAEAQPWLERTARLRPTADVWMMISDCRAHTGDQSGSLQAARIASQMEPDRPRYLERYVELLARSNSANRSDVDAEIAELKQRIQILRDYRARVDQMPRSE